MRIAAALLCASPALAGEFLPPAGCETWLTVQAKECRVANYYRCDGDAPGDQWKADFTAKGPVHVSRIDAETRWVESFDPRTGVRDALDAGAADPASFSELLRTGEDRFDFTTTGSDGVRIRYSGYDRLTGRTVTVDRVVLQETAFDVLERPLDGSAPTRQTGNQLIHPGWRRFFPGPTQSERGGVVESFDRGPVLFIFPGEAGFAATTPQFGCDAVISALPAEVIRVAD